MVEFNKTLAETFMRDLILTILLFLLYKNSYCQTLQEKEHLNNRLLKEISKTNNIESYCLGIACNLYSETWLKADSLLRNSSLPDAEAIYDSNRYVLKYYSFFRIFQLNDSIAFTKLKEIISDTTLVQVTNAEFSYSVRFNQLISSIYITLLEMKYKYGGFGTWDHRIYHFPKADPRQWKVKYKEVKQLISKYHLKEKL